jgi:hypothetical protein
MKTVSKQTKTKRLCYLCAKPGADTKDHIPPRDIFPVQPTGQLITVPAHYDCNHSFHKEDELFRNLITVASTRTPEGYRAWKEQVIPSWQNNPGAKKDLQKRLTSVWIKDAVSGGLLRSPAMKQDVELVQRQIDRWTRGLFYHKFKEPMPPSWKVTGEKLNPPEVSLIPFLNELAKEGVHPMWVHVEPNVFSYAYIISEEGRHVGFAIFVFFNTEVYMGATGLDRIGLD